MSLRASINSRLDVTMETDVADAPFINQEADTIELNALSYNDQLTDADDPALEEIVAFDHTLAGSTDDLDLTAALRANNVGDTVDLTNSRLLAMKLVAPATNTAVIALRTATADGYPLGLGISLYPGEDCLLFKRSGASSTRPKVDATHKILTIDGTNADKLQILAAFGDS